MRFSSRIQPFAALLAAALLAGACGTDEPTAEVDAAAAAIVPGADFAARIDVEAIRSTPACADFVKDDGAEESGAEDGEGEGLETPEPPVDVEKFLEVTGLGQDDLLAIVISGDLDELDFDAPEGDPAAGDQLEKANGVLALQLARAVSSAALAEALKASAKEATVTELDVAGAPAVRIEPADPDEPTLYAASGPGERVVFLTPNIASMEGALSRASSGRLSELPPALESVQQALPAAAQAKVAFLAPAKLRESVAEQLAKAQEDPSAAMTAGFLEPFKDLQSLALGVQCGEELKIDIAGDLGEEQASSQVAGMLQAMVLPMLKGSLAKSLGKTPAEIGDRFEVASDGPALRIGVRMTADDLAALSAQGEEAAAETGDAPE